MNEWKLLIGTREVYGTADDVAALHEQLSAAGVECYVYRRARDFDPWMYVA